MSALDPLLYPRRGLHVEKNMWVGYTVFFRFLFRVQLPPVVLTRLLLYSGTSKLRAFSFAVAPITSTPKGHRWN